MNRSILLKLFVSITLNMVVLIFFINLNLQQEPGVNRATNTLPLG